MTLQDVVVTGGYYLASSTLQNTLFGSIHTFVLPFLLTEGEDPAVSNFTRRIVQHFHNAFVLNDSSDKDHLPSFASIDGVKDLCALFGLAIFMNTLDRRTYMPPGDLPEHDQHTLIRCHHIFDLNGISIIERHQNCYTRGLVHDLVHWFLRNYAIMDVNSEEVDGLKDVILPFTAHIAHQLIRYHNTAVECGHQTVGSIKEIERQVRSAIFHIPDMKEAYDNELATERDKGYHSDWSESKSVTSELYTLEFDFGRFMVDARQEAIDGIAPIEDFCDQGKNLADQRFFLGLSCQFDLSDWGNFSVFL